MKWENLLLLPVIIILDIIIGLVVNSIFLAFQAIIPMGYLILIIIVIDIVGLISLWDKIQSLFDN